MQRRVLRKALGVLFLGGLAVSTERLDAMSGLQGAASRANAAGIGRIAGAMGMPVFVDDRTVYGLGYSIVITPECNGLPVLLLLLAGAGTLPWPWKRRLRLLVALGVGVPSVNLARMTSILALGVRSSEGARIAHDWIFPALIASALVALGFSWRRAQGAVARGSGQLRSTSSIDGSPASRLELPPDSRTAE